MNLARTRVAIAVLILTMVTGSTAAAKLSWIIVDTERTGFAFDDNTGAFVPWGFNYDHDQNGRLIEDYWDVEWDKVVKDFQEMKRLGANVVRIHLQFGKFMQTASQPDARALERLAKLLQLAEQVELYLDLTGLGCYHKADVLDWYDALNESERWEAQSTFWIAVAKTCAESPAIFCYDLMNEPVVPGGKRGDGDWLGPPFAGKHFVQFVTLDQKNRPRSEIARKWVQHLVTEIRKHDKRHLITVGLVDWSLDRPGLTSGFVPDKIVSEVDFLCVHLYPEAGKHSEAMQTLKGFAVGKPVVIEETFPLRCSMDEFETFVEASKTYSAGCIGFYWGQLPSELRRSKTIANAITADWLEFFEKRSKAQ